MTHSNKIEGSTVEVPLPQRVPLVSLGGTVGAALVFAAAIGPCVVWAGKGRAWLEAQKLPIPEFTAGVLRFSDWVLDQRGWVILLLALPVLAMTITQFGYRLTRRPFGRALLQIQATVLLLLLVAGIHFVAFYAPVIQMAQQPLR